MERKKSYARMYAPTSAARIASVRNKRETILLEKASKGLSCESDGTVRSFFREKARANNFLQRVNSRSKDTVTSKFETNAGQLKGDNEFDKTATVSVPRSELRERINTQRTRRVSLDVNKTEETQRRIQEFLLRDIPGDQPSKKTQIGQSNRSSRLNSVACDFEGMKEPKESSSTSDESQTQPSPQKPFRVRSRVSGICFSCAHSHLHRLPSLSVPNLTRTNCSDEYRLTKSSKASPLGKISVPAKFNHMPLDRNNNYDVSNPYLPSTGNVTTSGSLFGKRPNVNAASTRKKIISTSSSFDIHAANH